MGAKESPIEQALVAAAKSHGAVVRKVAYQGRKGAPDRWLFFPGGKLLIVECKAPGEKPDPLQLEEMRALRKQGFRVAWIDSTEAISVLLREVAHDFPSLNHLFPL